jgi:hypothetical protein
MTIKQMNRRSFLKVSALAGLRAHKNSARWSAQKNLTSLYKSLLMEKLPFTRQRQKWDKA